MKPSVKRARLFIGSSAEGLKVAKAIQANLEHVLDSTIWHQGVFGLSSGTLESLVKVKDDFDFAVLVLTADDLQIKRGVKRNSPRDNVLFELGFFMGALGHKRTFIVHRREEDISLPSDLAGITAATFVQRDNLRAALGTACSEIEEAVEVELKRTPL